MVIAMRLFLFILIFISVPVSATVQDIDTAIAYYQKQGAGPADAQRGKQKWQETRVVDGKERNCSSCHGKDLGKPGKHVKTGKTIDPMAVSINAERFSDMKKIKKWLKRNCKWTFDRECDAQEKVDFLMYLRQF